MDILTERKPRKQSHHAHPIEKWLEVERQHELRFTDVSRNYAIHTACGRKVQIKGFYQKKHGAEKPAVLLYCSACDCNIRLSVGMYDRIPIIGG